MAADELAFDKYKSVVDYITSNTGQISASLKTLIENTLVTRADSVLNVVASGSSTRKINIGSIQIDFESGTWSSIAPISVDQNGIGEIEITRDGNMPLNALLSIILTDDDISKISETFITKLAMEAEVYHYYSPSVTSFAGDDVPSMEYFFDNYYSISDVEFDKHVIVSSRDVNDYNNVLTYSIGSILSGAKKNEKNLTATARSFNSNILYANEDRLEMKIDPSVISISGDTDILNARSNKSVVLQEMLPLFVVYKDLKNIDKFSMQEPQNDVDTNVATLMYFDELLSSRKKVLQKNTEITQTTINGLSTDFASTSFPAYGTEGEKQCFTDILKYNILETALRANKSEVNGIGAEASSILGEFKNPTGDSRNRAVSMRTLYAMVSATLASSFPSLMINASEKLALSSQINLIVQESDSVFGSRPVLNADTNEISDFSFISEASGEKEISEREMTLLSWGEYSV